MRMKTLDFDSRPAPCLPGEDPIIDMDTLSKATKLLVVTVPPPSDKPTARA